MLMYSLVTPIYVMITTGFPTGALYVIVAVLAVIFTIRLNRAYKKYKISIISEVDVN